MRVIRSRNVVAYVDDDIYEWPAHRKEIEDKVVELSELINSLETGRTEVLRPR